MARLFATKTTLLAALTAVPRFCRRLRHGGAGIRNARCSTASARARDPHAECRFAGGGRVKHSAKVLRLPD